ncbi:MAG: DUF928 domain-containing protein [Geminocystis sp.]|nr:DUF928 domain-containing protein [Geminocystis sp.]HIK38728.1 DUF928 domain-containing protein [Geminocystis sp. M7585_C2015_104]MCS7148594.1 DUF928 domain-containing protein [Geminocystis sp.]MCX8078143.1 DUF928 domain-containing protein [Geminocystis sp.]MDW8115014.1 DUF928 domain-containing protein [Geminocystis sp.]
MGKLTKRYSGAGVGFATIMVFCCVSLLHSQTTIATTTTTTIIKPNSQAGREKLNPGLKLKLPPPPPTGTPIGSNRSQTRGATRSISTCNLSNPLLVALTANQGNDYTLHRYPHFWFYLLVPTTKITNLEFTLKDTTNQKMTYHPPLEADSTGLFRISLPKKTEFALKDGENYTWELKIVCQEGKRGVEATVTGGIQKLATTPELELQLSKLSPLERYELYRDNNLWYDAVDELARLYQDNIDNLVIREKWQSLLKLLQLQDLSFQPKGG